MQVLVVGGEHAFVQGTFANKLGSVGVGIGAHWDWTIRRPPQTVPRGCSGVVVLHDMVGHHLSNAAKTAADAAKIPFALVPRKFSAALPVLRQAGIVASDVPDEHTDDVPVTVQPDPKASDLRSIITIAIEGYFELNDAVLTDMVCESEPDAAPSEVYREVVSVRKQMLADWSARKRSATAELSLENATRAWLRRNPPSPDDPGCLSRMKADTFRVFGTAIPEFVMLDYGFQTWELRGLLTRERVRSGVRKGDLILASLTPAEFDAFRNWVITEKDNGKKASTPCPLKTSVRGLPIEGLAIMLRAVPDMSSRAADRVYNKMSGASLGPYYHTAALWGLSEVPAPEQSLAKQPTETESVADLVCAVPSTVPEPIVEMTLSERIVAALFGSGSEPSVETATLARIALDAVNAAAESVAAGGDTTALDALVRSRAADIIAAREIVSLEEKAKAAEAVFLKAQEEFLQAQAAAEEARNRVAVLRTGKAS